MYGKQTLCVSEEHFFLWLAKAVQTRAPLSLSEVDNRKLKWNLEVIWPLPLGGRQASSKPWGLLVHDDQLFHSQAMGRMHSALGSCRTEIQHARVLTLNQILRAPPIEFYLNKNKSHGGQNTSQHGGDSSFNAWLHKGKIMVSASYSDEWGPGQWLLEVSLAVGTKIWVTLEMIFF